MGYDNWLWSKTNKIREPSCKDKLAELEMHLHNLGIKYLSLKKELEAKKIELRELEKANHLYRRRALLGTC